ncbi:MAG: hypothetical protein JSR99_08255 [Proteobacteria bacterium]|nr:hypothetical protein [Pseudomonadota bacterium]
MSPEAQMAEFMSFEVSEIEPGSQVRRSGAEWVQRYQYWSATWSISRMPEWLFLDHLKNMPGIAKTRERIKDEATQRVVRNEHGTPLRAYYYTLVQSSVFAHTSEAALSQMRGVSQRSITEFDRHHVGSRAA